MSNTISSIGSLHYETNWLQYKNYYLIS